MSTRQMNPTIDSIQQESGALRPYPPSFVDRLMEAVQRLPVHYGLTYLALFVLQSVIFHALAWVYGWVPPYTFSPLILLFPLWLWAPLAIMTYLNASSLQVLASFRPLLDLPDEAVRRLEFEFTCLPRRGVIISSLVWAAIYMLFTYWAYDSFYVALGVGRSLSAIVILEGLVSYTVGSAIYYHSYRQLRLVNRTVKMVAHFDLFRLDPVYAFSALTSQTGVSWVIMITLTLLMLPIQLAEIPALITLSLQLLLAVAGFALPLWIVHQRLVLEKRRLLAEQSQRMQATLAVLNARVAADQLGEMAQLNSAISGLNSETAILEKIPTWPWRAGLLTGFLSIVVLPIILFLVQLVLGRLLTK